MTITQLKKTYGKENVCEFFHDKRAWIKIGAKMGHVDENGNITTPVIYDEVSSFREKRACVRIGYKWGHVNLDGNVTTPIIYNNVGYFDDGTASVEFYNKMGYVGLDGKLKEEYRRIFIRAVFK